MNPSCTNSCAIGIDPGAMPPMSAWCARLATYPTSDPRPSRPGRNTGETIVTSGRCVPPRKGSFRIAMSPGDHGASSRTAPTDSGIAPRCTGMCAACASSRPPASNTAQL